MPFHDPLLRLAPLSSPTPKPRGSPLFARKSSHKPRVGKDRAVTSQIYIKFRTKSGALAGTCMFFVVFGGAKYSWECNCIFQWVYFASFHPGGGGGKLLLYRTSLPGQDFIPSFYVQYVCRVCNDTFFHSQSGIQEYKTPRVFLTSEANAHRYMHLVNPARTHPHHLTHFIKLVT